MVLNWFLKFAQRIVLLSKSCSFILVILLIKFIIVKFIYTFFRVLVCYEGNSTGQNMLDLCNSKCGIYVTTRGEDISIMRPFGFRELGLSHIIMAYLCGLKKFLCTLDFQKLPFFRKT